MSHAPFDYTLVHPGEAHDVATNARRVGVLCAAAPPRR